MTPPACRRRHGSGRCVRTPRSSCWRRSRFTSYSACGIPFLVGGLVSGGVDPLVARTPEEHRQRGIDVRIHHEARAIDLDAGRGRVPRPARRHDRPHRLRRAAHRHRRRADPARPAGHRPAVHPRRAVARRRPDPAGAGQRGVPARSSSSAAATSVWRWPRRTSSAGCTATVIERAAAAAGPPRRRLRRPRRRRDAGARHRRPLRRRRRRVRARRRPHVGRPDRGRPRDPRHRRPARSDLAARAGIELGAKDAIRVDERQETSRRRRLVGRRLRHVDAPRHRPARAHRARHVRQQPRPGRRHQHRRRRRPSPAGAGHGDHQAVRAGDRPDRSPRRAGTAAGFDAVATTIDTTTVAGYLPHAAAMTVRMVAERGTGRAARRPDHRRPGLGQAHRHRRHGDHRRHDRRRRDGPRPRVRAAVLVGVGPRRRRRPGGRQGGADARSLTARSSSRRSSTSFGAGSPSLQGSASSTRS